MAASSEGNLPPYDEADLLSIIRMLPDIIFRCERDDSGRIYWTLNEGRLAQEFGLTTEQIRGKSLEDIFPDAVQTGLKRHFDEAFDGRPTVFINEIDGRYFKHYPQPVYAADGHVEAIVGFITEVTESVQAQGLIKELNAEMMKRVVELNETNDDLQRANQELARANQDLDAFAYTVSHDLRTPLTVIQNLSHVLQIKYKDVLDEKGLDHIAKIRKSTTRLDNLIGDILSFSRASRMDIQPEMVDLSSILDDISDQLHIKSPERMVRWHIQPGVVTQGDPGLLRIALENLAGNAWKYTGAKPNANIRFRCERVDGEKQFILEDDGIGFSDEDAESMFEAFQRLEGSKQFEGTGIGLATVKRIMERHGGTIRAEGKKGEYARFVFTLDVKQA